MMECLPSAPLWCRGEPLIAPMLAFKRTRNNRGFSLVEMVVVVAIVMIMAKFAIVVMTSAVANIKLHYAAINFSGLLQKARIEAVRKNTFYTVQQDTMPAGDIGYYVDLAQSASPSFASGDPVVELGRVTVFAGTGSGAPQETSFVSSRGFTINTGTSAIAAFNARGLPCIANLSTHLCPEAPGQGFVYFLSMGGTGTSWAAVVITPSGRVQTWSYDNSGSGSWVQQ